MHNTAITKLISKQGIVGLQKLEAWKIILPEFSERVGNVANAGKEVHTVQAIAKGVGSCRDLDQVLEMLDWLEDGEYLVDYGYLLVSMLMFMRYENSKSLKESKYMRMVQDFIQMITEEDRVCMVTFLLDYKQHYRKDVVTVLKEIQGKLHNPENTIIQTDYGYSCITKEYQAELETHRDPLTIPGYHYSRYYNYRALN